MDDFGSDRAGWREKAGRGNWGLKMMLVTDYGDLSGFTGFSEIHFASRFSSS